MDEKEIVSDMIKDGMLCEECGTYLLPPYPGKPQRCPACLGEAAKADMPRWTVGVSEGYVDLIYGTVKQGRTIIHLPQVAGADDYRAAVLFSELLNVRKATPEA